MASPSTPDLSVVAAWQLPDRVHAVTGLYAGTSITYTVTDTGTTAGTLYNVRFSDLLPTAGGVHFYPTATGTYTGCGSGHADTVSDGFARVTVTGLTVTQGTPCEVTFGALGTIPGKGPDEITGLAYATSPNGTFLRSGISATPATLQVLQQPAVTLASPTANASYGYGEPVQASYGCSQPDFPGGITGCYGYDEIGNEIDSRSYLDTLAVGTHTLTVFATNIGDGFDERDVSYSVRPFAIRRIRSPVRRPLRFEVDLPIQGELSATLRDGKRRIAALSTALGTAGVVAPMLRLNRVGRHLLALARRRALHRARQQARKHHGKHRHHHHRKIVATLRVTLHVTFTPSRSAVLVSPYFSLFNSPTVTSSRRRIRLR